MTCIIGLVDNSKVYIGADSASSLGRQVRQSKLPKVFRNGDFIIGYTTSFRMGQILQHHLAVRNQFEGEADDTYMVKAFAEAVRTTLKEHGFAKIQSNEETGGDFLVGYRGRLYSVASDFQVNEMADGYDACGCGETYALGAMEALTGTPPEERILRALEIADHFSGGVLPPFHVVSDD